MAITKKRSRSRDDAESSAGESDSSKVKINKKVTTTPTYFLNPCNSSSSFSSSSSSTGMVRVCVMGGTIDDKLDWFLFDISLDTITKQGLGRIKLQQRADNDYELRSGSGLGFHHRRLHHRHHRGRKLDKDREQLQEEGLVISPVLPTYDKPLTRCLPVPFWGNSFASLGSIVYSIGGSTRYRNQRGSNLVHYLDTRRPHEGWKQAASMINARFKPQVVSLNGKLYAFGCSDIFRCRHRKNQCGGVWAEVFDPWGNHDDDERHSGSVGRWKALPEPPSQLLEAESFVVITPPNDHLKDKNMGANKEVILVNLTTSNLDHCGCAYEFHVAANSWKLIKCDFEWDNDFRSMIERPILVDNVLYWVDENINAYDMATCDTYVGPVQDLLFHRHMRRVFDVNWDEDYTTPPPRPSFIHLGGRHFCLMCFVPPRSFHCLIIKVSRTQKLYRTAGSDYFFLNVSVLSCQSYPVDRNCFLLDGRMLL